MAKGFFYIPFILSVWFVWLSPAIAKEETKEELRQRIETLEKKVEQLEKQKSPSQLNAQPSDRKIEWHDPKSGILGHFGDVFGTDVPPPPASQKTISAESGSQPTMTQRMRDDAEEFYRGQGLREWVLGGFTFQGFVDAQFIFDEDILFDGVESFNFHLNQIELDIIKKFPKVAYLRADIDFTTSDTQLEQGYIGLLMPWGKGFDFRFGRFNSPIGTEGVDQPNRIFVNQSIVKAIAMPNNFNGMWFNYPVLQQLKLYFILANGWDIYDDVNDMKTLIGRAEWTPLDHLVLGLSGGGGPEQSLADSNFRQYVMLDAQWTPHPRWDFTFDATYGFEEDANTGNFFGGIPFIQDANWWGGQLTALFRAYRWLSLAGRYEYFLDDNGARFVAQAPNFYRTVIQRFPGESIMINSLSGLVGVHFLEGSDLNIEYQYNNGEGPIFFTQDGTLNNSENVITFDFVFLY